MLKSNIKTLNFLFDVLWNQQKIEAVHEIFHKNLILHTPTGETVSLEEFKKVVVEFFKAFPDIKHSILDSVSQNNKIAVRWQGQGTHTGAFLDLAPTNRFFCYEGITIFYFDKQHLITEAWIFNNFNESIAKLKVD